MRGDLFPIDKMLLHNQLQVSTDGRNSYPAVQFGFAVRTVHTVGGRDLMGVKSLKREGAVCVNH